MLKLNIASDKIKEIAHYSCSIYYLKYLAPL